MRFILIDKILSYEKGKSAMGIKEVSMTEDFFSDHFPKFPIMPGVLQLEAILQLTSWLVYASKDFTVKTKVEEVKGIKYSGMVRPGDRMVLNVDLTSMDDNGVEFKAKVSVDDKVKTSVKSGRLSFVKVEDIEDPVEAKSLFDLLTRSD